MGGTTDQLDRRTGILAEDRMTGENVEFNEEENALKEKSWKMNEQKDEPLFYYVHHAAAFSSGKKDRYTKCAGTPYFLFLLINEKF